MKFKKSEKINIYKFCRDQKSYERLQRENSKYELGYFLIKGFNFDEFLTKTIKGCKKEFALISLDNVVLPWDINDKVDGLIEKANNEFGEAKWSLIGNYGQEFLSNKKLKYVNDQKDRLIVSPSKNPRPVTFLESNTVLLNLKTLREENISNQIGIKSFNLSIFCLLMESYKNGLVCAVDSDLYAYRKFCDEDDLFIDYIKDEKFIEYWKNNFINHSLDIFNKKIKIENDLNYLKRGSKDERTDFYKLVEDVVLNLYKEKRKVVFIVIRTMLNRKNYLKRLLDSINSANLFYSSSIKLKVILSLNNLIDSENYIETINEIKNEYSDLSIQEVISSKEDEVCFGRVAAIRNAIGIIENKDSFIWLIDDDDFIFPNSLKYLNFALHHNSLFLGNSVVFKEKWIGAESSFPTSSKRIKIFNTSKYYEGIEGINNVPICSVIYPFKILKKVLDKNKLLGDYNEDYVLFLLGQKEAGIVSYYDVNLAGISFHNSNTVNEKDRTHWNYSYATFMNEVVNSGFMNSAMSDYLNYIREDLIMKEKREIVGLKVISPKNILLIFKKYQKGGYDDLIYKAKEVYRRKGLIKVAKLFFGYLKHGRAYFRDGVDSLD